MKHNAHCTCSQCSKTGMTRHEQAVLCNGNGQRKIAGPDLPNAKEVEVAAKTWRDFQIEDVLNAAKLAHHRLGLYNEQTFGLPLTMP